MKYVLILIFYSCLYAYDNQILDSSFSFIFETDSVVIGQDSVGLFEGKLYNLSNDEINLEIIRIINFVNEDWISSICIDAICYNQSIDNISVSIAAGDSTTCGVLAWTNGIGSDSVQLKLVELDNPNNNMLVNINFSAQYGLTLDNQNLNANSIKILSCYPNPFNSSILFKYKLGISNEVKLAIFNVLGEEVKFLVDEVQEAGNYYVKWDGNNGFNQSLPSGAYFLRIKSGDYYMMKKITLMK